MPASTIRIVGLCLGTDASRGMRLWSLHPKYLDAPGLVALWREALLAQAVLRCETKGYRSHPQLHRFRDESTPVRFITTYLQHVHFEAVIRGCRFDGSESPPDRASTQIEVPTGQLEFEWLHLAEKLRKWNPECYAIQRATVLPVLHPLFRVVPGEVTPWERGA